MILKIKKISFEKGLSWIIIFIALTKSYVVFSYFLHLPMSVVTSLFFMLSILFCISNVKNGKFVTNRYWFYILLLFLIVSPSFVIFFTKTIDIRTLLLNIYFFILFVVAVISVDKYGIKFMSNLIRFSLMFTIFFGFYSVINPTFFSKFAVIVGSYDYYHGRAFGLYLQPNSLGTAVILMCIASIATSNENEVKYNNVMLILSAICLVLSGSRSNMGVFFLILIFNHVYMVRNSSLNQLKRKAKVIFISVIALLLSTPVLFSILPSDTQLLIQERTEFISNFMSSDSTLSFIENDGSIEDRLEYQNVYIDKIKDKLYFGYGIGIQGEMVRRGEIINTAHNVPLEYLLQGGIFYFSCLILFYISFLLYLVIIRKDKVLSGVFMMLSIYLVIYSNFTTTILAERVFYVVLGVVVMCNEYSKNQSYKYV